MSDGTAPGSGLPEPFSHWIRQALGASPRPESAATCEDCAMCRAPTTDVDRDPFLFDPSVKCCTYLPELPNFSVGQILRDDSQAVAAGRQSILNRMAVGDGVTPLGLEQTQEFRARYRADDPSFGREPKFRCPHYETGTGQCGIWPYRESTCSTWSCKHDRGALGQSFRAALRELLKEIERQLAWWCVNELGLAESALAQMADLPVNPLANEGVTGPWGPWLSRKEEWYEACAERVDDLTWGDVLRITGPDVEVRLHICRRTWALHEDGAIPSRMSLAPYGVAGRGESFVRIAGYSPFDPLDIPDALADVLPRFDGRPTEQVVSAIARERGLQLDPDILRPLVDHQILTAVDGPRSAPSDAGSERDG